MILTRKIGILLMFPTLIISGVWAIIYSLIDLILNDLPTYANDVIIMFALLGFVTGVVATLDVLSFHSWIKGRQVFEVNGVLVKRR